MCTSIVEIAGAQGAGRSKDGWFSLTHSVVAYDHPQHALLEEAVTIDFVNHAEGPGARAAVELTLESARALHAALAKVIEAAEIEEGMRAEYVGPAHPHSRKLALVAA
jgi:pyrimidine operon attenuation protein/uracil phosphoribosyltransferase